MANNKTDLRISNLIKSQVPFFVRNEHPQFVAFLEAYYEYLEKNGKPLNVLKEMMDYQDVDETLEKFMKMLHEEYLNLIPKSIKTDRALMIKNVKDLYRAKGSEKALKFLLNILFGGKEADIYYPKKDVLRASDGKWYVKKTLKIKDFAFYKRIRGTYEIRVVSGVPNTSITIPYHGATNNTGYFIKFTSGNVKSNSINSGYYIAHVANANTFFIDYEYPVRSIGNTYMHVDLVANNNVEVLRNFINKTVTGDESGATAVVESLETYYEKGYLVNELEITNQKRSFSFSESVSTSFIIDGVEKHIKANIYSGIVSSVKLIQGGSEYDRGMIIPVESNTGSGAIVRVDDVTDGGINSVIATTTLGATGAGFQGGEFMTITGGGDRAVGANARVELVSYQNEKYHPNSYDLVISLIADEANTRIGNARYSNCNSAVSNPANVSIANSMLYWTYANCGPFETATVLVPGVRYRTRPQADVRANTRISNLGILGRMEIIDGGLNYRANDKIEFINVFNGYGSGAKANVTNVNAAGTITEVKFEKVPGYHVGGQGYNQDYLPLARVVSANGTGANIVVTAVLGDGESLVGTTTVIGKIKKLTLVTGGSGYEKPPLINLKALGAGTAQATANIITGVYEYDGRYINDDGHLSGFNYLQDRDYYQQYSYVVRLDESLNTYRKAVLNLLHPAGLKLFGEHLYLDNGANTSQFSIVRNVPETNTTIFTRNSGTYSSVPGANGSNVTINITSHGLSKNGVAYVEFTSNTLNNADGYFKVQGTANSNVFFILYETANNITATGNVYYYKRT